MHRTSGRIYKLTYGESNNAPAADLTRRSSSGNRAQQLVPRAHRFRLGQHDVDLIARRDPVVAFVEVKTRGTVAFGSPLEAVGWRKRYRRTAPGW